MFVGKKFAAFTLLAAVYFGYRLSEVYIPEKFEGKGTFRVMYGVIRLTGIISRLAADLGFGTEPANFRYIASKGAILLKHDEHVKVENVFIDGIRVRVYTPRNTDSKSLPAIIYYHGGGFFMGLVDTYDPYFFQFVKKLNVTVMAIAYRLAPEHPFPTPTDDCYKITRHVIKNPSEFRVDLNRLALMGDSAGGTVVAALTQRFNKEKLFQPRIQVLIYPLVQFADAHMPAYLRYFPTGVTGSSRIGLEKFTQWYFGILNRTDEIKKVFRRREHFALLDDPAERSRVISSLDIDQINSKYKQDMSYYKTAKAFAKFPSQLPDDSRLKQDKELRHMFKSVFKPEVSPLFAHDNDLKGLPKAYFILLEWDFLKDEGILYANRLRKAGVDVHEAFYENAYHGIASTVEIDAFTMPKIMQADLIEYLKANL